MTTAAAPPANALLPCMCTPWLNLYASAMTEAVRAKAFTPGADAMTAFVCAIVCGRSRVACQRELRVVRAWLRSLHHSAAHQDLDAALEWACDNLTDAHRKRPAVGPLSVAASGPGRALAMMLTYGASIRNHRRTDDKACRRQHRRALSVLHATFSVQEQLAVASLVQRELRAIGEDPGLHAKWWHGMVAENRRRTQIERALCKEAHRRSSHGPGGSRRKRQRQT